MEISLGDKIWAKLCGSEAGIIVGYVVDSSPKNDYVAISGCDLNEFNQAKGKVAHSWFKNQHLSIIDRIAVDTKIETRSMVFANR